MDTITSVVRSGKITAVIIEHDMDVDSAEKPVKLICHRR